jgi:hypothetical protein
MFSSEEDRTLRGPWIYGNREEMKDVDSEVSPERLETLRRANEALQRAMHWANWMEAVDQQNSRTERVACGSRQSARFGLEGSTGL